MADLNTFGGRVSDLRHSCRARGASRHRRRHLVEGGERPTARRNSSVPAGVDSATDPPQPREVLALA